MTRVFQWASGTVGRHAALAVLERDGLELVGLHTLSPAKAGRDVGELLDGQIPGAQAFINQEGGLRQFCDSSGVFVFVADAASGQIRLRGGGGGSF